jgi:hypothetical protein
MISQLSILPEYTGLQSYIYQQCLVVVHSEHKMDVIKVECSSVSEDDPSSSHHQGQLINTNVTVLPLATPVFRAESHANGLVKVIQNGDIQFAQYGDCQSSDNGDSNMRLECIEFADIGEVKHGMVEKDMEDKNSAQNKGDGSSGQENLPAMGCRTAG